MTKLNDITNLRQWGRAERYRLPFKEGQPFILELVAAPHNTIIVIIYKNFYFKFIFRRFMLMIDVLQLSLVKI